MRKEEESFLVFDVTYDFAEAFVRSHLASQISLSNPEGEQLTSAAGRREEMESVCTYTN